MFEATDPAAAPWWTIESDDKARGPAQRHPSSALADPRHETREPEPASRSRNGPLRKDEDRPPQGDQEGSCPTARRTSRADHFAAYGRGVGLRNGIVTEVRFCHRQTPEPLPLLGRTALRRAPMRAVSSPTAPPSAGPYSAGVVVGDLASSRARDHSMPRARVPGDFAEQTRQTFRNLESVAQAAGTTLHNAVRIGVYLKDLADFPVMNEIAKEFLSEPYPRTDDPQGRPERVRHRDRRDRRAQPES